MNFCLLPDCFFLNINEIHQLDRVGTSDVVNVLKVTVFSEKKSFFNYFHYTENNIINVRKIPFLITVVV